MQVEWSKVKVAVTIAMDNGQCQQDGERLFGEAVIPPLPSKAEEGEEATLKITPRLDFVLERPWLKNGCERTAFDSHPSIPYDKTD
jgi:hypothetical protein